MVKHTQTVRRLLPTNRLTVLGVFVGLALPGLKAENIHAVMHQHKEASRKGHGLTGAP